MHNKTPNRTITAKFSSDPTILSGLGQRFHYSPGWHGLAGGGGVGVALLLLKRLDTQEEDEAEDDLGANVEDRVVCNLEQESSLNQLLLCVTPVTSQVKVLDTRTGPLSTRLADSLPVLSHWILRVAWKRRVCSR